MDLRIFFETRKTNAGGDQSIVPPGRCHHQSCLQRTTDFKYKEKLRPVSVKRPERDAPGSVHRRENLTKYWTFIFVAKFFVSEPHCFIF